MAKILTEEDYKKASETLNCEIAVIKAVAEVEAEGAGFLLTEEPKILYEPYVFGRLTNHEYDKKTIQIDAREYPLSLKGKWNSVLCKYGPPTIQHTKLAEAVKLNREAALKSCSWGKFQIMGENYQVCGFKDIQSFITAMYKSEGEHLLAFCNFVKGNKLDDELRNKNWKGFARGYNGPSYEKNKYNVKLEEAYKKYKNMV